MLYKCVIIILLIIYSSCINLTFLYLNWSFGIHTVCRSETLQASMLATFTPSGTGCVYHDNGNISFLCNDLGGTLADNSGSITRRWTWPPTGQKLPTTVVVPVSITMTIFHAIMLKLMEYNYMLDPVIRTCPEDGLIIPKKKYLQLFCEK